MSDTIAAERPRVIPQTDAALATIIERDPGALARAQVAATQAHRQARLRMGAPIARLDALWSETQHRTWAAPAHDLVARLRVALEATALFDAIAHLPSADLALLELGGVPRDRDIGIVVHRYPVLAAWWGRVLADRAVAAEHTRLAAERQQVVMLVEQERARQAAAEGLLAALAARGIHLQASRHGDLTAQPAGLLTAADRTAIADHRERLIGLLMAPAEAV